MKRSSTCKTEHNPSRVAPHTPAWGRDGGSLEFYKVLQPFVVQTAAWRWGVGRTSSEA